jgi:hypothetical protein
MAQDAYLTDAALLAQNPEATDLSRQRKLAEMLSLKAFEQPQGNMVSGHYVAPSWTQQLAPLVSGIAGQAMNEKLDKKQLALAEALRQKQVQQIEQFGELQKADPNKALQFALSSDNPILRDIAKEELKGIKLGEGEVFTRKNLGGGVTEIKGGTKYHAPISVDTGNSTILLDPLTKQKIAEYPKAHQPVAGQVLETDNGPMLINTRTGQAQPIMAGGQAVAGGKPLTESQAKATAFQSQMIGAENNIKQLEAKGFNPASLQSQAALKVAGSPLNIAASPETQQYKQAQEQWAEAYLRFKTGAAATEGEVQRNIKTFFPQFGDKPAQIAQKADARRQAEQDIGFAAGMGAGRGAKPINLQPNSPQAPKKVVNFNDLP